MPGPDIGMLIDIDWRLPKFWDMLVGRYPFSELGDASSSDPRPSSPS